ncbi:MAG: hypothetical protein ACRCXZ_08155 [Patescibacteria group bacterium]
MSIYKEIMNFVNNETLIQKGQKLFIEGKVLTSKAEVIPQWFSYGVKDRDEIYEILAPNIHLIKPDLEFESFFKLAHCNCEYYHMMGHCHHLIAVLAHLDNKFKSANNEVTKVNDSLWDSLMLGEKTTIVSQYKYHLDNFFEFNWGERDITKNLGSISKDMIKYPEIKDIISDALKKHHKDFNNEKKIISLFTHSYIAAQNSGIWFRLFLPYLKSMHTLNKEQLGIKIFLNIYSSIFTIDSHNDIISFLKKYESDEKKIISKYFLDHYKKQPKIWQSFALQAQDQITLIENIEVFDIRVLLQISNICPNEQDLIENKVFNLIKEWSDFLITTDYTELLTSIEKWYLTYGKTEKFIEATDYIIASHPKKKNLIKELENY